jgi:LacI family transcriptional regulator, gluconate utilization system Gnt-I transcriptional repressor
MAELGLKDRRVISFGTPPISMKQGSEAMFQLKEQWPDVEAAICVSDLSAFGALVECQRRKWAVPRQIAIAGFGDFEISNCSCPTLTTVDVNCYEIGKRAGQLLLKAIEGEHRGMPMSPETVITHYSVVSRESA